LQMFDFCRRSFSRDLVNHIPDFFNGCVTVNR